MSLAGMDDILNYIIVIIIIIIIFIITAIIQYNLEFTMNAELVNPVLVFNSLPVKFS